MIQFNRVYTFWCSIILCTVLLLVFSSNSNADDSPASKIGQKLRSPTLKFLYCYSCGYRKMFDQYVEIINQKYPYILVDGMHYEPAGLNMFLSRLLGLLKLAVNVCILGGVNIFEYINQPRPGWWVWCTENKVYACMMLFFLCNILEGQLVQSGAFEISLNDVPVWSKLETGRIPQPAELFQIIDSHMQFTDKVEYNNGFAK